MNRVTTEWVLFSETDNIKSFVNVSEQNIKSFVNVSEQNIIFKGGEIEYKIVDVKYLRPRSWRFYSSSNTYVLAVLNDSVRIQSDPDFVIRFPDTINDFLRSKGMIVR